MTSASMAVPTRRVDMWYAGTAPQSRVTVIFRVILAIPQFIVLFFLGIAAFVVTVIGWFAALVTGELPEFAHTFLSGVIRWEIRVNAYMFLLTDAYPPFSLEDVEYPVRTILPARGPLNRVSVFFRIILAIPAFVFAQIVEYGLTAPLLFVMWIVVIVTGSMPSVALRHLLVAAALPGPPPRVVQHGHVGVRLGMLGDFVPPPPAYVAAAARCPVGQRTDAPPPPPPLRRRCPRADRRHRRPRLRPSRSPTRRRASRCRRRHRTHRRLHAARVAATPARTSGRRRSRVRCPRRHRGSARPSRRRWTPLPSWGILILQGAARSWMIFAIVWGSIVFIGENAFRNHGHNNNDTTNGLIITVPADTSGLSHVVCPRPPVA